MTRQSRKADKPGISPGFSPGFSPGVSPGVTVKNWALSRLWA